MTRNILFISGTRADFGKLKSLIQEVKKHREFDYSIFATGMHLMSKYGNTIKEIYRAGFDNVFPYMNQVEGDSMDIILANTIKGLSRYLDEYHFDLIIVHGDRAEALAGAITGALNNILVGHIEGGEISGTIDELIRHSTSKLAHLHFVSTSTASSRLIQLGEKQDNVFNIGAPNIDIMFSDSLPDLDEVKNRYQIPFNSFALAILHPVTTEIDTQYDKASIFVDAILASQQNYIVIYPNNDVGADKIFEAYKRLGNLSNIKIFPSLRFEYFLMLLKHSNFIIGNSSAGIHEAPVYGVPTINIGNRQNNRFKHQTIYNIPFDTDIITNTINSVIKEDPFPFSKLYGTGDTSKKFIKILESKEIWDTPKQKQFLDLNNVL